MKSRQISVQCTAQGANPYIRKLVLGTQIPSVSITGHLASVFQLVPLTGQLLVAEADCLQSLLKHSLWFSFTQNTFDFHAAMERHNVQQSVVSRDDQKITSKGNFLSDPECYCTGTCYFGSCYVVLSEKCSFNHSFSCSLEERYSEQ